MSEQHLQFKYDQQQDVMEIEGIAYSGDVFRQLGGALPVGATFKLVARGDGVLTIYKAEESK